MTTTAAKPHTDFNDHKMAAGYNYTERLIFFYLK